MALKAVLFDLGLTLTKTASFPEIYRRILARFGVKVSTDDIVQAQKATESEFDVADYDENRRKEIWTKYNLPLPRALGQIGPGAASWFNSAMLDMDPGSCTN